MKSTRAVVDNHLKCFGEGDLDGIMSDYAPDAVLLTADGVRRGPAAIRPLLAAMIDEFGQPGTTFALHSLHVEGEHAFISWTAKTPVQRYELATDTFCVLNGRIAVQSFAARTTPAT